MRKHQPTSLRKRSPRLSYKTNAVTTAVDYYLDAATSAATRRAYASDIARFERAGYSMPCAERELARYLAEHAATLAVATLRRHLVASRQAHTALRVPSPVSSPLVKTLLRGIRCSNGGAQRGVKALDRSTPLKVLNCLRISLKARIQDTVLACPSILSELAVSRLALVRLGIDDYESMAEEAERLLARATVSLEGVERVSSFEPYRVMMEIAYAINAETPIASEELKGAWCERARIACQQLAEDDNLQSWLAYIEANVTEEMPATHLDSDGILPWFLTWRSHFDGSSG